VPRLTPVYRLDGDQQRLIPGKELANQIQQMERFGVWALQHGLNIADQLLDPDMALEARSANEKLMGAYLAAAGAALGAINGRVNAFRFLQEVDRGEHPGGDAIQYRAAGPPGTTGPIGPQR